jgi:7-carboxy-7-deazaguanine synthase
MNCQLHDLHSGFLPVVEMFHSIQGEGLNTGKPAFFIRLAGCDVCCTWCDEKIAWDEAAFPRCSIDEMIGQILESKTNTVVITGGEPFRHNLSLLTETLHQYGMICMAETSGTGEITGRWNWITLSPKKKHPPLQQNYQLANELKVVIQKETDFSWAEHCAVQVGSGAVLYLQPEWSRIDEILPQMIRYIKNNPKWRLSVQMHKFINIP